MGEEVCRLAVDIGGTFTDVVLWSAEGQTTAKVLTTAQAPEQGVLTAVHQVLNKTGRLLSDVSLMIHGTTLATNALIERKGAITAFLTSDGFRDILEMGYEKRFAHYDLNAARAAPLVPRPLRYTVPERMTADGRVHVPLDQGAVRKVARLMSKASVEAIAVGFIHAYAYIQHEQMAAEILQAELPGVRICLSSDVCPEMREYERFSTTCANAYVQPLMVGYLDRLSNLLTHEGLHSPLYLMMSGGGLTTLDQAVRYPVRLIESGPAGGALMSARLASARKLDNVLSFDMGGTTAKISLIQNGRPDRSATFEVAREYRDMKGSGLPVRIPVIDMVEIGAGGGSIARVDTLGRIGVGPDSAGSKPGPVAYGMGGEEPTVTDADLVLGRLDSQRFAGGGLQLDEKAARTALAVAIGEPLALDEYWPAVGVIEMVEENMANAARVHAVERGKESGEYTMIAFGGAAPLHAARLAEKLGMDRVIVPPGAGVGSAIGFLQAPVSYQVVRSLRILIGTENLSPLIELLDQMLGEATQVVVAGSSTESLKHNRQVALRYLGQGHELSVNLPDGPVTAQMLELVQLDFESVYRQVYGLTMPDIAVECVSWSVTVMTPAAAVTPVKEPTRKQLLKPCDTRPTYDPASGEMADAGLYWRAKLNSGDWLVGPALVQEDETVTFVPSGYICSVDEGLALVVDRESTDALGAMS
ncbi:MAG TPA: hydantoinase/oxoprolinase family protein [Gammaproteobacteria bacterium]|nr:hydantoinase/oxoprolinase family protein [Gammaproteobacteria bacterium]